MRIPQGNTFFSVWDGDFDLSNANSAIADTDDPNTPASPPSWSTPAAVNEGANQGAPADDNTPGNNYLRTPSIRYSLIDPDGTTYQNLNPSGGGEWEEFRISSITSSTAITDYYAPGGIPAGLWQLSATGVDLHNLNALRFEHPIIGVDSDGNPFEPVFPYALGDRVWFDSNRDAVQDSGETSITGVFMTLRDGEGSLVATAVTDAAGFYEFTTLPGTYTVDVDDPSNYASGGPLAGLTPTTDTQHSVVVTSSNDFTLDFGLAKGPALVVTKTRSSPSTVAVGEESTYTVTVRNVGETTATSFAATDTIDGATFEYVAGSTVVTWPPSGSSSADPSTATPSAIAWDFSSASLAPSATLTFTYRLRVKPAASWGSYTDTVAVAATDASGTPVAPDGSTWIPADTDPDDMDTAGVWVTVPGVSVSKSLSSAETTVQPSDVVVVHDRRAQHRRCSHRHGAGQPICMTPDDLAYLSAVPSPSLVSSGSLSWANVGPLDSGEQTTVTVSFLALASPPGWTSVDTATVGPATDIFGRVVPADSDTASVAITNPHLSVSKVLSSSDATVQVGQGATYTIVVKNDGTTRIDSLTLSDQFEDAYLDYTTATPAPPATVVTTSTYATATTASTGWSNTAASLGAPDTLVANSTPSPFSLSQLFAVPSGVSSIDEATVTVRSRALGGWGGSVLEPRSAFALPVSTVRNGNWVIDGSTPAGTRHESIDDTPTPDDGVTYIRGTGGTSSQYGLSNPGLPSNATNIEVGVRMRIADSGGANNVWHRFQVGGANYLGTSRNPSTTWTTYTETYTVNPDTGLAWLPADVNGTGSDPIEGLGPDSSDQTPNPWVTEMNLQIAYDVPVNRDDTWGLQYSTNSGSSWGSIVAASTSAESGLADHALSLTGILDPLNIDEFRVRALGSVVGTADGVGTMQWDATRLDLKYQTPQTPADLVTWDNLGPLDPGEQTTVTISFLATDVPADNTTIDTATVAPTVDEFGDPVPTAEDTAPLGITRPEIAVTKSLSASQDSTVGIGASVNFDVVLTNTGDTTVTAASIVDTWTPGWLQWSSAVPPPASLGSGVATFTLGSPLPPGESTTYTVEYLTVAVPPGGTALNSVLATDVVDVYGDHPPADTSSAIVGIVDAEVEITKVLSSADSTIQPGEPATFTVVVRNAGSSTLTTVPVSDTYDTAHLAYAGASPAPDSVGAGVISWDNVGPLTPGQQTTLTVGFTGVASTLPGSTIDTATVAGARDASDIVAGSVSATAAVAVSEPTLSVTKTNLDADGRVPIGGDSSFLITVTNSGDTTMTSTTLTDSWTAGLSFASSVPATVPVGSSATWEFGSLAPGASTDITVTLTGTASGIATNTAGVTGIDINGDSATPDTATATALVTSPGLTVTKIASQAEVRSGEDVTYTVLVQNSGDTTLAAGTVSDTWDASRMVFQSSVPATVPVSNSATFTVANLGPGDTYPVTMVMRATTTTGTAINTAQASGVDTNGDPVASPPATETVVVRAPLLTVNKVRTSEATITAGEDVTWRIDVTNSGDATASPVTVSDSWTAGLLTYQSASITPDATSSASATFTVSALPSGDTTSVYMVLRAVGATGTAQNVALASTPGVPDSTPSTATVNVGAPVLAVSKVRTSAATSTVGETTDWLITVTNTGDATATPVTVADSWTSNLQYLGATPAADATESAAATWTVPSLPAGAATTITVNLRSTTPTGVATNSVIASSPKAPSPVSDSATVTVVQPVLEITKTLTNGPLIAAYEDTEYTITVRNLGDAAAVPLTVEDTWTASHLDWDSASVSPDATSSGAATWTVAAGLLPGESWSVDIVLTSNGTAGFAENAAMASAPGAETVYDSVLAGVATASLEVSKSVKGSGIVFPGEQVGYTVVVTNSGGGTAPQVEATDTWLPSQLDFHSSSPVPSSVASGYATWSIGNLKGGESYSIDVTLTALSPAEVATNTATALARNGATASDDATVTIADVSFTFDKSAAPATYSSVGETITYTYTLTNTGNVTLENLSIADDHLTVSDPTPDPLDPGQSATATVEYVVVQADLDAGTITNIATATAEFDGTPYTETDTETVTATQSPAYTFDKSAAPATYSSVGETITYTYTLTNTGNVTLENLSIADDHLTVSDPTPDPLDPGQSATATVEYVVVQADLDAGTITNIATATAEFDGTPYTETDTETVTATQSPAYTFDKSAAPATYSSVGETITYTYTLTNTGNVTLENLSIADDHLTVSDPTPDPLDPGQSATATVEYVVVQADLDAGTITNIATATAEFDGTPYTETDTETVTATQSPAYTFDKSAAAATYSSVGETITYTYTLTNTGNVTLENLSIADDHLTVSDPTPDPLDPGQSATATVEYVVVQADLDAGTITNIATATAEFDGTPYTETDTETVTATQSPAYTFDKSAASATYSSVGETITYTYTLTNTGNVTLENLSIADDHLTVSDPTPDPLDPGQSATATVEYVVVQADLDAGTITNIATATAEFDGTPYTETDTETVTATQSPAYTFDKSAAPATYSSVGETITYTYTLTNTGNVTLENLSIADDRLTVSDPTPDPLDPGQSATATVEYVVVQADLDAGTITNIATATAEFDGTPYTETDTETVTATQSPAYTFDKSAASATYSSVGETITYTYTLTNTGNVTLENLSIADDHLTVSDPTPDPLDPGQSATATVEYVVVQADLDAGTITNIATATAEFDGTPYTETDTETVTATQSPAYTFDKSAAPATYSSVGETITYTYTLTNTGNVTLENLSIADDHLTVSDPTPDPLDPGQSATATVEYVVVQADLDAGTITNIATATAEFDGTPYTETDTETVTATQSPAYTFDKSADAATYSSVGETITYTYTLTNTGNVTLENLSIADDHLTVSDPTPDPLDPGQSATATVEYVVVQADLDAGTITNIATATAEFDGTPYTETDTETVTATQSPAYTFDKSAACCHLLLGGRDDHVYLHADQHR